MKNTRRFLAAVMALAMISAIAPMSAIADDSTTLTITKVNPYDELYIITIPANTTIENTGWTDLNALNVKYNGEKSFDPLKMITVTAESANGWKFKSDEADTDIGYTLKSTANDTTATTSWVFSANAVNKNDGTTVVGTSKTIGIDVSAADYEAATAATYSDIITFTVAVSDNPYSIANVGDVVAFGDYDWYVIDKKDSGVTLLMQETFMSRNYNDNIYSYFWNECSLRSYLNGDFYNSFSAKDKAMIALTHNINPKNPANNVSGGPETDDYIYLLSIDEATALDSSIRNCGSSWWLRSTGTSTNHAALVTNDGSILTDGEYLHYNNGVRPVLNLEF